MVKKPTIQIPYGVQKKLASEFDVSTVTIRDALCLKTNSKLAKEIRNTALTEEYGGYWAEIQV